MNKIIRLQKKAMRIIAFRSYNDDTSPIYKSYNILKLEDNVKIQNCILIIIKNYNSQANRWYLHESLERMIVLCWFIFSGFV